MYALPEDHAQFDEMCGQVTEWEPMLPSMSPEPVEPIEGREQTEEEETAALDGLILAGLVAP